jgi:hypothetical protein
LLGGRLGALLAVPAVLAAAAVLAALVFRWEFAGVAAVALLGGAYVGALFLRDPSALDPRAPLYAVGLALLPELVAWSTQSATRVPVEAAVQRVRLVTLTVVLGVALGAGALVVAVADVEAGSGLAWEAAGVAAALGALALVVALAGRHERA